MGNAFKNLLTTLWIGGMWVVGVLVAPVLYHNGALLGRILNIMGWIGIVAGIYLVIWWIWVDGLRAFQTGRFWLVLGMLACTLVNQFAVFPLVAGVKPAVSNATEGLFGGGLSSWSTISSLIYLVQSVLGVAYIWSADNK